MRLYLIAFDFDARHHNYEGFISTLQGELGMYQITDYSCFVRSDKSASQLYTRLKPFFNSSDYIVITEANKSNMQGWLHKDAWKWVGI